MFSFIHAADIHLDSPLLNLDRYEGAPSERLRGATRRAFENMIDLAIREKVDFVIIAGDLFDGNWKDYSSGLYLAGRLGRLKSAGIPVFIASGNHDAASVITKSLRLPDNIRFFSVDAPETDKETLKHLRVAIHGQGFKTPGLKKNIAADYPNALPGYYNIGILHTNISGSAGHDNYAPSSIQDLLSKDYQYFALGHIHTRAIIKNSPFIVYPGNIQGRHIKETGPKGCMLVKVDDTFRTHAEFVPLHVLLWERLRTDISEDSDADADQNESSDALTSVLDAVSVKLNALTAEQGDTPMAVRIEITGETKAYDAIIADRAKLKNDIRSMSMEFGDGAVWIEKIILNITPKKQDHPYDTDMGAYSLGPSGEIESLAEDLENDPDLKSEILNVLTDVMNALPPDVKKDPHHVGMNDEWIRDRLKASVGILNKSLKEGGAS